MIEHELRLTLLRELQDNPEISQRELAEKVGVSLGKTNYALRALIERGWVKVENFGRSRRKHRYLYELTPSGLAARARITRRFLKRKIEEHEHLLAEIEQLRREVQQFSYEPDPTLPAGPHNTFES